LKNIGRIKMAKVGPYNPTLRQRLVDSMTSALKKAGYSDSEARGAADRTSQVFGGIFDVQEGGMVAQEGASSLQKGNVGSGLLDVSLGALQAAAGLAPVVGGTASKAVRTGRSTIQGALRKAFPGIYDDPRLVAERAESMVMPESSNLSRLFGVTREDLSRAALAPGTTPGVIPKAPKNPRGSEKTEKIMSPANTRRLVEGLQATEEFAPNLRQGMTGWYMMDPAYQRLVELVGPEEAVRRYERFNALTAMSSPSSDVVTELRRGTAANKLAQEGRFNEFMEYGGLPIEDRIRMGLPTDLLDFPSHAYHSTAQAPAMEAFLREGMPQLQSPKVPLYLQASQASEIGRQSDIPVGDAHWSRGVGLADVRPMRMVKGQPKIPGQSVSTGELAVLAPWWRESIAKQAGMESVPAQATAWGLYSPATGVETPVGQPKLEILSDLIEKTSSRLNVPIERARDMVLLGEAQAGRVSLEMLGALGASAAAIAAYTKMKEDENKE
jgi:hypothetical protein